MINLKMVPGVWYNENFYFSELKQMKILKSSLSPKKFFGTQNKNKIVKNTVLNSAKIRFLKKIFSVRISRIVCLITLPLRSNLQNNQWRNVVTLKVQRKAGTYILK